MFDYGKSVLLELVVPSGLIGSSKILRLFISNINIPININSLCKVSYRENKDEYIMTVLYLVSLCVFSMTICFTVIFSTVSNQSVELLSNYRITE